MSSPAIRVDDRELVKGLEELASQVAAMPETWDRVGEELLPGVRQRTPVRSGAMRDSWEATGAPGRAQIGSELPYAGVIEAVNRPIGDTIDASSDVILATLEEEIARAARSIGFEVRR